MNMRDSLYIVRYFDADGKVRGEDRDVRFEDVAVLTILATQTAGCRVTAAKQA